MMPGQVRALCARYSEVLRARGVTPARNSGARTQKDWEQHLAWMCSEIPNFLDSHQAFETDTSVSKREKAMRWLGFVQGQFAAFGIATVEEMKEDNR